MDLIVASLSFAHNNLKEFKQQLYENGHGDTAEFADNLNELRIEITSQLHELGDKL